MTEKELIRRALLGDKQAQEECAEKGIALPCPLCRGDVTVIEVPAHKHYIVDLPEYGGSCFIECNNCTYAISGDDRLDALRTHNTRPDPPIGRCGECKHYYSESPSTGYCDNVQDVKCDTDYCSCFEPKEEE